MAPLKFHEALMLGATRAGSDDSSEDPRGH